MAVYRFSLLLTSLALLSSAVQAVPTTMTPTSQAKTKTTVPAATPSPSSAAESVSTAPQAAPSIVRSPQTKAASKGAALITQNNFKDWFNQDVIGSATSDETLTALIQTETKMAQQQVQNFYTKLRQCVPGTYQYPIFNPAVGIMPNQGFYLLETSKIEGTEKGKCKVSNVLVGQLEQTCHYSSDHLNFFTDTQALDDLQNPLEVNRSAINQILKEDCVVIDIYSKAAKDAYLNGLANCTPGTYNYAVRGPAASLMLLTGQAPGAGAMIAVTSVITGIKDGHCMVDTSSPNVAKTLHCGFSHDSAAYVINKQNTPPLMAAQKNDPLADVGNDDVDQSMTLMEDCGLMPKI